MPLDGFLFKKKSEGKYRLSMDFGTPVEGIFVQDLVVRVRQAAGLALLAPVPCWEGGVHFK